MPTHILSSESDSLSLGKQLAAQAHIGDVIALSGPLGAGKTVVARGFVQERAGQGIDVASPTFTLVHVYDQCDPPVWHFDLYRVEDPEECAELGLEEALASGISVIEWPENAGSWLPQDRLDVTLLPQADSDARQATLSPGKSWRGRVGAVLQDDS